MKFGFQKEKEAVEKMGRTVAGCPFRTKYHIMPPVGWLNDPNGLCQFRGIYHAYFQYSPLNVNGGGGYWGHCTSRDMLHWEYQDPVLTADTPEDEDGVYSGSALVEDDRMYLFYTGNVKKPGDYDYIDQGRVSTQILVESGDGQQMSGKIKLLGMEDYPDSMTQHIRDPKVWKEEGQYFMVLGARERAWDESGERADRGGILIYRSGDRKNWTLERSVTPEQRFGYMWECPDIFELGGERFLSFCPQGLPSGSDRYQNIYQSGYCFLSDALDPETSFREWDMGFDFYAPQTFEAEDGRRILIGWAGVPDTEKEHRNLSVENGWQHCLTLPCELTKQDGKILRMPVRELQDLPWEGRETEGGTYCWKDETVCVRVREIRGGRAEIRLGRDGNCLTIRTSGSRVELSFLNGEGELSACGGGRRNRIGYVEGEAEELFLVIDSSIAEIFVNNGEIVLTTRFYLGTDERGLSCKGSGRFEILAI